LKINNFEEINNPMGADYKCQEKHKYENITYPKKSEGKMLERVE
jgi:hypothetical protein